MLVWKNWCCVLKKMMSEKNILHHFDKNDMTSNVYRTEPRRKVFATRKLSDVDSGHYEMRTSFLEIISS